MIISLKLLKMVDADVADNISEVTEDGPMLVEAFVLSLIITFQLQCMKSRREGELTIQELGRVETEIEYRDYCMVKERVVDRSKAEAFYQLQHREGADIITQSKARVDVAYHEEVIVKEGVVSAKFNVTFPTKFFCISKNDIIITLRLIPNPKYTAFIHFLILAP
ncbi:1454_t:CDS:2 [Paraglomus occultum]|uniref:1454_t:CDS:1 n=1 Tax=Paraglomus occultum TaxID=144539 RepID=A0A9N9BNY2_9GLOM|nr:1454_t:CDS:2 [Paraglomus occultum]